MHMGRKPSDKVGRVRTTITLDPDVAKILEGLQRETGLGMSDVLNDALRKAATTAPAAAPFVQETSDMGAPLVPIDCTGRVLTMLDEQRHLQPGSGG